MLGGKGLASCRIRGALGPASCNLGMTASTGTILSFEKPVISWQRQKTAFDLAPFLVRVFLIIVNEDDYWGDVYLWVSLEMQQMSGWSH